jgi:hypothetical protein
LDELVVLARRDRPAPSALMAVARGLRVPFVAVPVAAIAVPSTALASVVAKVGLSRLALLGWGAGSAVAVSGVVAAVALHEPAQAPALMLPVPTTHVAKHQPPPEAASPTLTEPETAVPAPNAEPEHHAPVGAPTWDEPQLIERARKALATDPRRALALTQEHQRRFPAGALGVEREVIALEALARTGQTAEARRRALAFTARYPKSIHTPQVRALLTRLEAKDP